MSDRSSRQIAPTEESQRALKPKHSFLRKDPMRRIPVNPSSKQSQSSSRPGQQILNSSRDKTKQESLGKTVGRGCADTRSGKIQKQTSIHGNKENEGHGSSLKVTFGGGENWGKEGSFLRQEDFQVCPILYWLWRAECLEGKVCGDSFELRTFSKGRKQMKYRDGTVEVLYEDIKLTRWLNGDFKLIEAGKVSFWSEGLQEIDVFFID